MFGSLALETVIGLVLMFFVISIVASSIVEILSQVLKKPAKDLEATIGEMLARKPETIPTRTSGLSDAQRTRLGVAAGGDDRQASPTAFHGQKSWGRPLTSTHN